MSRIIICFWIFKLIPIEYFFQNNFALEFINGYPIKIDGGCNFFTFDSEKLESNKFIYIVSRDKIGFFKLDGKFIYVSHKGGSKKTNGYIDRFSGDGYDVELSVTRLRNAGASVAEVLGVLQIVKGARKASIDIHGINEDGSL